MTSADVPPPSSTQPVTMKVHRRLNNIKKPWGPVVLRIVMSGQTTTTLAYENVGLDSSTFSLMTSGLTGWANRQNNCPILTSDRTRATEQTAERR